MFALCAALGGGAVAEPLTQAAVLPDKLSLLQGEEADILLSLARPMGPPVDVRWELRSRCGLVLVGPAGVPGQISPIRSEVIQLRVRASKNFCSESAYLVVSSLGKNQPVESQFVELKVEWPEFDPAKTVQVERVPVVDAAISSRVFFYWRIRNLISVPVTIKNPNLLIYGAGLPYELDNKTLGSRDIGGIQLRRQVTSREEPLVSRWCFQSSDAVSVDSVSRGCNWNFSLAPGGELMLPVLLIASFEDTQKQSTLVLRAQGEYLDHKNPRSVEIQDTARVSLGYQDLVTLPVALSLPSYLFLPGILCWIFFHWAAGKPLFVDSAVSEWVPKILFPAASISMIFFAIYYYFERNLLAGFSVYDLFEIWILTMSLGIAGGLLVRFSAWLKSRTLEENRPAPSDQPGEILRKAIENRSDFKLYVPSRQSEFKSWHESCWFLVTETDQGKWLAPVIEASLDKVGSSDPASMENESVEALRIKLAELSCNRPFLQRLFSRQKIRLARKLREAEAASDIFLRWSGNRVPRFEPVASFAVASEGGVFRQIDTDLRSFFELKPLLASAAAK